MAAVKKILRVVGISCNNFVFYTVMLPIVIIMSVIGACVLSYIIKLFGTVGSSIKRQIEF